MVSSKLAPDLPTSSGSRSKRLLQLLDVPASGLSAQSFQGTKHHEGLATIQTGRLVHVARTWLPFGARRKAAGEVIAGRT